MSDARFIARRVASATFLAVLGIVLVGGLIWALSPESSTGFQITEGGGSMPEVQATPEEPAATATPDDEPAATPTPTPTPTEDVEALIAAARDTADTTVQVLEAGGGMAAAGTAADHLAEELGYDILNVTSARVDVAETTVWFTDGNEAEARALRARAPQVAVVEANQGLNEVTDLHLLVGPDWPE